MAGNAISPSTLFILRWSSNIPYITFSSHALLVDQSAQSSTQVRQLRVYCVTDLNEPAIFPAHCAVWST